MGAGQAGDQLIREINWNEKFNIQIDGIVDDDTKRHGRSMHGIPILGPISKLGKFISETNVQSVLIAIPSARPAEIKEIVRICQEHKVEVKTLPSINDIVDGKVSVSQLRSIEIDDLLRRDPVNLDMEVVQKMIHEKVVFVSGAGGLNWIRIM